MPDPSTSRLGLYKSKSDGSELVSYPQDIGGNFDKLDLATGFQAVTSTTRPSAPYSGKPIAESDTGRLYYSNGSAPASGSWVEIASNGASFTLTGTRSITLNGTANTTTKFAALVSGDTNNRFEITADGTNKWGSGSGAVDVQLGRTGVARLGVIGSGAALGIGGSYMRPQAGATATVANTLTETVIATLNIPASDAAVGATYRITVYGTASVTATPTITVRGRLGGVAGTLAATLGPVTASTGVTNQTWSVDFDVMCLTTGASGTWMPRFVMLQNVTGASVQTGGILLPTSGASLTRDTTASSDMVVTWQWSAASASNTATARAICRRVA